MSVKPPSDYRSRGFTQLHIKKQTKDRLNMAKARMTARVGKAVTHDDLISALLDCHTDQALTDQAERVPALP